MALRTEVVDLVGMRTEESGAGHDLGSHQHGRDHQREALLGRQPDGQLHDAQLHQCAEPGQEREARTGDLRAALHVDHAQRLTEFQVVLGIGHGRGLADRLEYDEVVLAAGWNPVDDDVADRHVRGGQRSFGGGLVGFGGLDLIGQGLRPRQQGGPLVGRGPPDVLAGRLLLGAQVVCGRDGGAPRRIGLQRLYEGDTP